MHKGDMHIDQKKIIPKNKCEAVKITYMIRKKCWCFI